MKVSAILGWILILLFPSAASAKAFEISGNFSFSKNSYGNAGYEWTRRWGASVGYTFWGVSEFEISVEDVTYRTVITNYQDTTFHDQIYSFDLVQSFTSKEAFLQPYVKIGIGQLNREASGTYSGGSSPPAIYDALTVIAGVGLRIFIVKNFGLRAEALTYLTGGAISTWQDNVSFNGGVSIYF
jgi:hypothetical protein